MESDFDVTIFGGLIEKWYKKPVLHPLSSSPCMQGLEPTLGDHVKRIYGMRIRYDMESAQSEVFKTRFRII